MCSGNTAAATMCQKKYPLHTLFFVAFLYSTFFILRLPCTVWLDGGKKKKPVLVCVILIQIITTIIIHGLLRRQTGSENIHVGKRLH